MQDLVNPHKLRRYDTLGSAYGAYVPDSYANGADEDAILGIYQFYGTGIKED